MSRDSELPPPWEIINLVSQYLDPKTLAISSCVNKTWFVSMSSDQLWKPFCFYHYPSLSILHFSHPSISYRRLYALAHVSSLSLRIRPLVPQISLGDISFTVDMFGSTSHIFSLTKSGLEITSDDNSLFRFDFDVVGKGTNTVLMGSDELRVKWCVVLKGWRGIFMVMDCKGKGRSVSGCELWFSKELPSSGCCTMSGTSGMVAELGFRLRSTGDDGKLMKVERVTLSFFSVINCRFMSIDDALRYLQRFLLPSH